jgi:hypothetical protein
VDFTGKRVLETGWGDIERISPKRLDIMAYPSAYSVAIAWEKFRVKFYENECKILHCKIFKNPNIKNNLGQQIEVSVFLGNRYDGIAQNISNLTLESFIDEQGIVKDKRVLENVIPGFSRTEYLRLRSDVQFLIRKYEYNPLLISKAKKLNDFLSEIKKR